MRSVLVMNVVQFSRDCVLLLSWDSNHPDPLQVEAANKGAKSESLKYGAELSQLTAQMEKVNEKTKLLSSELTEKVNNMAQY